ncbi:MAG: hypothetical protein R3F11_18920 [Verrucomicrobiales bacterium]
MLSRPFLIRLGGLVAACVLLWLFFVKWTPENQVRAKQEAFIEAASDKKWQKCRALMADSYSDRWGFNRDSARQALQDLGQRFLMLDVTFEEKSFEVADGTGTVKGKLTLKGSGPAASFVIPEVQRLKEPFVFVWKKQSWTPWSWRLETVEQPELELPNWYEAGKLPL